MKTLAILAFAAALTSCAETTSTSTTTAERNAVATAEATSAGPKKIYTRHDLDRSGRASTGPALSTLDPDISSSGN